MPKSRKYKTGGPRRKRRKVSTRLKKVIKSQILKSTELKRNDLNLAAYSVPIGGVSTTHYLTAIATGDSDDNREGTKIKIISVQLRGTITNEDQTGANDTVCRLILYRARETVKGVIPGVTEVLDVDSIMSLRDFRVQQEYKVLWDKTFQFNSSSDGIAQTKSFRKFISIGGLNCNYDGDTNTIADALTGGIFMILMTNMPDTAQPEWYVNTRVTFKDY